MVAPPCDVVNPDFFRDPEMPKIAPPPENAAKMVLSGWARRRRGGTVRIGLRDSSGPNCRCDRTPMVPMLHLDHRYPITFAFWTVRAGYTVGVAFP